MAYNPRKRSNDYGRNGRDIYDPLHIPSHPPPPPQSSYSSHSRRDTQHRARSPPSRYEDIGSHSSYQDRSLSSLELDRQRYVDDRYRRPADSSMRRGGDESGLRFMNSRDSIERRDDYYNRHHPDNRLVEVPLIPTGPRRDHHRLQDQRSSHIEYNDGYQKRVDRGYSPPPPSRHRSTTSPRPIHRMESPSDRRQIYAPDYPDRRHLQEMNYPTYGDDPYYYPPARRNPPPPTSMRSRSPPNFHYSNSRIDRILPASYTPDSTPPPFTQHHNQQQQQQHHHRQQQIHPPLSLNRSHHHERYHDHHTTAKHPPSNGENQYLEVDVNENTSSYLHEGNRAEQIRSHRSENKLEDEPDSGRQRRDMTHSERTSKIGESSHGNGKRKDRDERQKFSFSMKTQRNRNRKDHGQKRHKSNENLSLEDNRKKAESRIDDKVSQTTNAEDLQAVDANIESTGGAVSPSNSESVQSIADMKANSPNIAELRIRPDTPFERIGQVGEGTYGKVYKAKNVVTNKYSALKRIRLEQEKDGFPITATREIKLLQSLIHKNIVQLLEIMVEKSSIYMVFEYMDHDLTGVLSHPSYKLSVANIKHLSMQMLAGLDFLHGKGVLHRDIKGSNILLNNNGRLKIADFGLARYYQKHKKLLDYTNRVITLWYRPPELLLGATMYGPEVDIWSVGCLILEMHTRKAAFPAANEIAQLERIYRVMGTPTQDTWPEVDKLPWYSLIKFTEKYKSQFDELYSSILSPACMALVKLLLFMDPKGRPSASQALLTEYFKEEEPQAEPPMKRWMEIGTNTKVSNGERGSKPRALPQTLKSRP